MGLVAWFK